MIVKVIGHSTLLRTYQIWLLLHLSPVYYGLGAPKSDGSAVALVLRFLGTDIYLHEFYLRLSHINQETYFSGTGWNASCLNNITIRLKETVKNALEETSRKVYLIGHSLGGILSRSLTSQEPDLVALLIASASPSCDIRSHTEVLKIAEKIRKRIFDKRRQKQLSERHTVYTVFEHRISKLQKARRTCLQLSGLQACCRLVSRK